MKTAPVISMALRRITFLMACAGLAWLPSVAARAGNIFDDNWTPPKRTEPATPTPSPVIPRTPPDEDLKPFGVPGVRRPIPAKADQDRSRATLKELFAAQMTDASQTARRKLAGLLFETVSKTADNPVDQYVLLGGTINAAKEGANLPLCARAADQLSRLFDVDALALKSEAALSMPLKALSPADTTENLRAALELVDALVAEDDLASANRLCGLLKPLAATDAGLRPTIMLRSNDVAALRSAQERVAPAFETLKTTPNDPAANLAIGQYFCFARGWWDKGLPYLFKGADADLKKAAAEELAAEKTLEANSALGDAWWAIAEKQAEPVRGKVREHAVTFYKMAVPSATGLSKLKMEGRIAQVAEVPAAGVPASTLGTTPQPAETGLIIVKAVWKVAGKPDADITAAMAAKVKNNRLELRVTTANLGVPPVTLGTYGHLTVDFRFNGKADSRTVQGGGSSFAIGAPAPAGAEVPAPSRGPIPETKEQASILDKLTVAEHATSTKTAEGLVLKSDDKKSEAKLLTATDFKVPLMITAVMKTDSKNIRLYYKSGYLILNWDKNLDVPQYYDPKTGVRNGVIHGQVQPNNWCTVRWIITSDETRIEIDGVERGTSHSGSYAGLSGKIGVGTFADATVTIKSLTVSSTIPVASASPTAPSGPVSIEVTVPSAPADPTAAPIAVDPRADANVIERPEYQTRPKRLVKSVTSVTSMLVIISPDGSASGLTGDIIATVPGASRNGTTAGAGFYRADGDLSMKVAFEEAMRAVTMRYPKWEPGHIDFSFGEKFISHGGPSAGTAFALLTLSCLEGFELDPKCAVTGDISVDWRVRKVGGVTAKLRGATLDKCLYAAIPEENTAAFVDMGLLYGHSSLWEIQVFSINNLQQAMALARTDRAAPLAEAIKRFAELQPQLTKAEVATLKNPQTRETLHTILELAPNHESAKQVLALCDGTAPKTLSANASFYQLKVLFYPYAAALSTKKIDRQSLPAYVTPLARKRLATLRPIAHKDIAPLLTDIAAFIEAMDSVAGGGGSPAALLTKARNIDARMAAIFGDAAIVEKLMREGY